MHRISFSVLTLAVLSGMCIGAAGAGDVVRDHDIEAEDYFSIGVIMGNAVSPDGGYVAYTERRWNPPDEKRNLDLWVVNTQTRQVRRLTFDKASDGSPEWSPDGRYIYFSSNRELAGEESPPYDGSKQVWRISSEGEGLLAVTRVDDGINQFELSNDGRFLYYTVSNEETEEAWEDLRNEFSDLEYGHGVTDFSQLWKLDLTSWRTEKLIDESRVINDFSVSPDQSRIAMLTTPDEELIHNEGWSRVDVYDAATEKVSVVTGEGWRSDHPSPYGWLEGLAWSEDNRALSFAISYDGYPTELYVAEWRGGAVTTSKLVRSGMWTLSGGTQTWRGASRDLCFNADDRARKRVICINDVRNGGQGDTRTLTPGDEVVMSFDFDSKGDVLAVVAATTTHPPDIALVSADGDVDRLTRVNPQVDRWKLPQISLVKWKGADGDMVEGILELPPDYKPGKPLPMVVEIHGGPTSASTYNLRFWIYGRTLLPAKGYALLSPNYHGSTGYGDEFLTKLIGRENDIEVEDILKGVEAMIQRGIADPNRIGVMGWSNGGFLTNCLITKSDRFKAASSGAGVLDMVIQWGTEDTPGHVINYMNGALPWSNPEAYRHGSPMYELDKVKTPTLIHVGGEDPRVPTANSRALYRALRHYLHVPTELIVYPGEGHGLTTYTNRKAKMKWDLAWFGRYLRNETAETDESKTTAVVN
ncbi:MAG: S9 family peptidase [Planctomycetes bacterium]|nr:S9 family peptidase [Planctomycetota bacterium]